MNLSLSDVCWSGGVVVKQLGTRTTVRCVTLKSDWSETVLFVVLFSVIVSLMGGGA